MSEHPWRESVAAFVLGALPESEAREFDGHLSGCEACRAEVNDLMPVTVALAASAPPVAAPRELRDRIMLEVDREAGLLRAAGPEADVPARPARRRRWWQPVWRPAAALAGALAAAAIGFAIRDITTHEGGPATRTVRAQITKAAPTGARATVEVAGKRSVLRLAGFPSPGRSRVYQVWVQRTPTATPIATRALFTVGKDGRGEVELPASARGAHAVLVSSEPAGGNRTGAPTRPPVLSASL
jgi:anti-sigma-K factor RskA